MILNCIKVSDTKGFKVSVRLDYINFIVFLGVFISVSKISQ